MQAPEFGLSFFYHVFAVPGLGNITVHIERSTSCLFYLQDRFGTSLIINVTGDN